MFDRRQARSLALGGFASGVSGENILIFGGETGSEARTGGQVFSGLYSLDTRTLKWERVDKFSARVSPSPRGLCASTTSSLDRNEGMLIFGGKTGIDGISDDFFFYQVVST
ncbi:Kelch-type beta propeller [Arabidopsis thaliana x Arabidopsis arenosa]|uniref:Kelch-type beta propeller n=1 Tax=Arabidopsis thaliana x Arabidopsis arenosa TaxID=1240361 RepID=A0A8T2ASA3_9BRAS|nr:Kelch-type beta propeller [Arabidopsis thaliana x Arabidopsis arenosa]